VKTLYALSWLVLQAGCASAAEAPDDPETAEVMLDVPECVEYEGAYRISYAMRSGDCAELPDQLATFDTGSSGSSLADHCEVAVVTSYDGCDREEDSSCRVLDASGVQIGAARLLAKFTQPGKDRIEGTTDIEVSLNNGQGCTGKYSFVGSKVEN
jgi:hypothetical protein